MQEIYTKDTDASIETVQHVIRKLNIGPRCLYDAPVLLALAIPVHQSSLRYIYTQHHCITCLWQLPVGDSLTVVCLGTAHTHKYIAYALAANCVQAQLHTLTLALSLSLSHIHLHHT